MSRADRAFAQLIATALAAGGVLALPLLITVFGGGLQRALTRVRRDGCGVRCCALRARCSSAAPRSRGACARCDKSCARRTHGRRDPATYAQGAARASTIRAAARLHTAAGRLSLTDATVCF